MKTVELSSHLLFLSPQMLDDPGGMVGGDWKVRGGGEGGEGELLLSISCMMGGVLVSPARVRGCVAA